MIRFNSALDSILSRGIANDGALNAGGIGSNRGNSTTPAKNSTTPVMPVVENPVVEKKAKKIKDVPAKVTVAAELPSASLTQADRDKRYREANAEAIKERDRKRKAKLKQQVTD